MNRTPKVVIDFSAISQIDWARLAAYIDGEGCIRIAGVKGSKPTSRRIMYLEVCIANTDARLGAWLKNTFGGSTLIDKKNNVKWSDCVKWYAASRHAHELLLRCRQYMIIKCEQTDVALAFQETIVSDKRFGVRGRPPEILSKQYELRDELSALKGTSSRRKSTTDSNIQ